MGKVIVQIMGEGRHQTASPSIGPFAERLPGARLGCMSATMRGGTASDFFASARVQTFEQRIESLISGRAERPDTMIGCRLTPTAWLPKVGGRAA